MAALYDISAYDGGSSDESNGATNKVIRAKDGGLSLEHLGHQ